MLSSVFRRVGAWGALAAFAASFALPILSTRHLVPDVDEGSRLAVHAEPQVAVPGGTSGDEHCAVCHWMRAVAGASTHSGTVFVTWFLPSDPVTAGSSDRQGRTAVPAVPSRAPPARLA